MSTAAGDETGSILLVDDMDENLIAFEAVLGPLQQELVHARSGEEALKAMLRREFAVVVIDVMMPGMDGFETAANIKRLDQTKDVPVILVTGAESEGEFGDYAYRGYAVGAADFLSKPIDPWLLRTKVNVFLDLHRKSRQLVRQAEQLRRLLISERDTTRTEERLGDVTARLARVEDLLHGADTPGASELADRIARLEHAVEALSAGDGSS